MKQRLDHVLVARGLAENRTKAQAYIQAGLVFSGDVRLDKPGHPCADDIPLTLQQPEHPWVSRGGQKLAHALSQFGIAPTGQVIADLGASTGGFTDVLLHHGAQKIYAVDVGYGQLDWRLRNDPRVVVLEKTNARYLTTEHIPEPLDALVCDASFISLKTLLPAPLSLLKPGGWLVVLIKPQFEVGKGRIGKGGVVRDPALHEAVCAEIRDWMEARHITVHGIAESPITGPKGNKEFLLWGMHHQPAL